MEENKPLETTVPEKIRPKNLQDDEKAFIEGKAADEGWTDKKIAEYLGRHERTIIAYRRKIGVKKKQGGRLDTSNVKLREVANTENMNSKSKEEAWKSLFKTTVKYRMLKEKLSEKNLDFFLEEWAKFHIQFDDMTATEEDNLELLISLKLRINDNQKALKDCQAYEESLKRELDTREDLQLETEEDRRKWEMIIANNKIQIEINKEFGILYDKYEKAMRALNGTREQREQRQQIGADTFLGLIRKFNERDNRDKAGRYNELMKMASNKQKEQWTKPHLYADGESAPILLLGEDSEKKND